MCNFAGKLLRRKQGDDRELTRLDQNRSEESAKEYAKAPTNPLTMSQTNGIHREQTPVDTGIVPSGRVVSNSMMRQGAKL